MAKSVDVAVVVEYAVRRAFLVFQRDLSGLATIEFPCVPPSCRHARDPRRSGCSHVDDLIAVVPKGRGQKQWNIENHDGAVFCPRSFEFPAEPLAHRRMNDLFEVASGLRGLRALAKDLVGHRGSIQFSVGRANSRAEPFDERVQNFGVMHNIASVGVRVENAGSMLGEQTGNRGLSASDSAGDTDDDRH